MGRDSSVSEESADVESFTSNTSESPSIAFLRDLARASDMAPNDFDVQLIGADTPDLRAIPFSGRFLIRKRLGAGGFGVVYEAFDCERNATVALKTPRRKDGRSISRFKKEFRSLVETVHENLVQLYELHAHDDAWFFTMELVCGTDMLAYVRPRGGTYDEERLRDVLRQLVEGLSFLHRAGKLHRDLKPSNVMVTSEGRVIIVDFGLAGDIADLATVEGVFGTPEYMAPEQAAGLPVGTSADWYAVGVMLYQALTGRLPLREPQPAPRPSALVPNVPEDLDRLCMDLLAREPEHRPTDREVRQRLARGTVQHEERSGSGDAPFIGRVTHLAKLHDALTRAEQGAAVTVLLHGRSGIGKTALIQQFLGEVRARAPGRFVLSGRCFEQESVPYKGVDGLIDDLCGHLRARGAASAATLPADFPMLARIFPQLCELPWLRARTLVASDDDALLRQRAFAALREVLAQAAPEVPVLVVDDLQWSDLDSVALLGALLQGRRRVPMLLLAA